LQPLNYAEAGTVKQEDTQKAMTEAFYKMITEKEENK